MAQIVPRKSKAAAFRKDHIIRKEEQTVLKAMGAYSYGSPGEAGGCCGLSERI